MLKRPWLGGAALAVTLSVVAAHYGSVESSRDVAVGAVRPDPQPGGATTLPVERPVTLLRPAANLEEEQRSRFYAGKALATQPWVRAPTLTDARDGLGPLYNAHSCLACHVKGGRGPTTTSSEHAVATLVRLSQPGRDVHGGPIPDPVYGGQLQPRSTSLAFQLRDRPGAESYVERGPAAEADVRIVWTVSRFEYTDGTSVELRAPRLELTNLGYGPLHPETRTALRHAPSLAGVGLLELVEEADVLALTDPEDRDGDGISGRLNVVWDPERRAMRPGRFGLKANQASLRVQIAAAFAGDMGITSALFPEQPCTEAQPRCVDEPTGDEPGGHEISEELLDLVVFFNRSIAVHERRKPSDPLVLNGAQRFHDLGCASCHTPRFRTGVDAASPHLSEQEIAPYTDLLIHDMGAGLADGREDFLASGSEWRTAPLWGVGLARALDDSVGFLHDGRARTVEEAILWHDGEGAASRDGFARLAVEEREAVLAFVRSL